MNPSFTRQVIVLTSIVILYYYIIGKIYNQVAATNSHLISAHCIDYVLGCILMSLFWSISVNWPKTTPSERKKCVKSRRYLLPYLPSCQNSCCPFKIFKMCHFEMGLYLIQIYCVLKKMNYEFNSIDICQ